MKKENDNNPCKLEHYQLKKYFDKHLIKYVNNITEEKGILFPHKKINVKGTTFAEYRNGKFHSFNLEEFVTFFPIDYDLIKKVDLVTFRSNFQNIALDIAQRKKKKLYS